MLRRGIEATANMLPVSHRYMSFDFKVKKFLSGFETPKKRRNTYWLGAFTPSELPSILNHDVDESSLLAPSDRIYEEGENFWDSLQTEYVKGYLVEDILVKVDRASMAHSLEVRAPFLDIDLVRFALALPQRYKQRGRTGKYILREVMRGRVPDHIIDRPKKGFNIPVGAWIQGELKELFEDTILDGALVRSGLFKRAGLVTLLESHQKGRCDNRKKLWSLLVLALWMETWHA
jgi:asparagine synthase (glutamine-hydrolysing)